LRFKQKFCSGINPAAFAGVTKMAWYAYCIAERQQFPELGRHRRPIPLAGVSGLFGNQTFLFPASELAVIVSEHNPEEIETLDQQAAKDHARVIADCFKHSTVLPFRFHTTFADDAPFAPINATSSPTSSGCEERPKCTSRSSSTISARAMPPAT
jgi:hypothetical protein